ncbi:MAG: DUF2339 domain-containing protein [bacterium]
MAEADDLAAGQRGQDSERRLDALESEVASLRAELLELRRASRAEPSPAPSAAPSPEPQARLAQPSERARPRSEAEIASALRGPHRAALPNLTGAQLESLIGRYGTLAAGALVILLGVGTLVVWAVKSGLLTPEVRVALGALAAIGVAGAGLHFRRKEELRYGNVLLALALAIVDVVAWGAGPQLHLLPTAAALFVVDVVAVALAVLALHDESEFLFAIAVAGALSAPFVTGDRSGRVVTLLAYGAVATIGAVRAARQPEWQRIMALLVGGAAVYTLVAASLPVGAEWYGPFAIPLFGGALALGALVLAQAEWRGNLARAFLAVTSIGVAIGWDFTGSRPMSIAVAVSLALAATTYAALAIREPEQPLWTPSALLLPLASLGVASSAVRGPHLQSWLLAFWGAFALGGWWGERRRGEGDRAGAHLLSAGWLVSLALGDALWSTPLGLVAGLAGWGVVMAHLAKDEPSPLPMIGVAIAFGGAAAAALDQLASLRAYAYTPFATRPSASALVVTFGLAMAAAVLAPGTGAGGRLASRGLRLGVVIGWVFLWGRMELVHAYSLDVGTFLLTLYYAAVGVGSIVAGRRIAFGALRVGGLGLAIFAAAKAVAEATAISSLLLRVGCYAAVGVFLLGAGYLYRNSASGSAEAGSPTGVGDEAGVSDASPQPTSNR